MARQIQTVKSRAESVWGAVVCSLLGVAGVLRAPPLACPEWRAAQTEDEAKLVRCLALTEALYLRKLNFGPG